MVLENFIVFEGIDGAGTTTQLEILKSRTPEFLFTAEPTSSETGKFLRKMLKGEIQVTNETAAYIFAADRNEHINGNCIIEENKSCDGRSRTVGAEHIHPGQQAFQKGMCRQTAE